MKKSVISFIAVLSVLTFFSVRKADAQTASVVHDPIAYLEDVEQFFDQTNQWIVDNTNAAENLLRIEKMNEAFDKWFGDESAWNTLVQKGRKAKVLLDLTRCVNNSTKCYAAIMKYAYEHFDELDPSITARLMNNTRYWLDTVKNCFSMAKEIISSKTGTAAEKSAELDAVTKQANEAINSMVMDAAQTVGQVGSVKGALAALSIIEGDTDAEYNALLKEVKFWSDFSSDFNKQSERSLESELPVQEEGSVRTADVLDAKDANMLSHGMKNAFKVISILLALLMAGTSIIVLVKWNRGEYGAGDYGERGFFSIGIAIIVVSFLLSILSAYVGFGL